MVANLEQAASYVEAAGTALDQARLQRALYQFPPPREVEDALLAAQEPDGSFGSVHATCEALSLLKDLGLSLSDAAGAALTYLMKQQTTAAHWDEPGPWSRYHLTALCTLTLATLAPRHPARRTSGHVAVFRAVNWLMQEQPDADLRSGWVAAAAFYTQTSPRPLAEEMFERLLAAVPALGAADLVHLLSCLKEADVPPEAPLVRAALGRLEGLQAPDGAWEDPATTAGAVKVLVHYHII